MEHTGTRGSCNKRNEQGLLSCGCIQFIHGGRDGQNDWCCCCEHHANMHLNDALPVNSLTQVKTYFPFPNSYWIDESTANFNSYKCLQIPSHWKALTI